MRRERTGLAVGHAPATADSLVLDALADLAVATGASQRTPAAPPAAAPSDAVTPRRAQRTLPTMTLCAGATREPQLSLSSRASTAGPPSSPPSPHRSAVCPLLVVPGVVFELAAAEAITAAAARVGLTDRVCALRAGTQGSGLPSPYVITFMRLYIYIYICENILNGWLFN
jgi:hypothetical protein